MSFLKCDEKKIKIGNEISTLKLKKNKLKRHDGRTEQRCCEELLDLASRGPKDQLQRHVFAQHA